MRRLLVVLTALCLGGVVAAQQPPAVHKDPFRGDAPFVENNRPPPLTGAENKDLKRVRSYAMQPPTIPHSIDNYQIDRFANKCMMCHSRVGAGESQATPISITHYTNRGGVFLADVDPRRYFCDTCHVVQMDVQPRVASTFEDVDSIVRRLRADAAKAKAQGRGK